MPAPPPKIIDVTLHAVAETPGAQLAPGAGEEIARTLAALGVEQLEVGHPGASPQELERVRRVVALGLPVPVLAHARPTQADVDAAAQSGAGWVGIEASPGQLDDAVSAVRHARSRGLSVRFALADGAGLALTEALAAFRLAARAGAQRIGFIDARGRLEPHEVTGAVQALREALPEVELEVRAYDDRGLSTANALAAVRAGAQWVAASVNGMGRRAGGTDASVLLANLVHLGLRTLPAGASLRGASVKVAALTRAFLDDRRPIVGRSAFDSESWVEPGSVGAVATKRAGLPSQLEALFLSPRAIPATELRHHRETVGTRFVMLDERVVPDARQYCIVRAIPTVSGTPPAHVDEHRHNCDSVFMFLGNAPDLTGLRVEARLGDVTKTIDSPGCVFIPAGVRHTYRIVSGGGLFINHVLAGIYNDSLLE